MEYYESCNSDISYSQWRLYMSQFDEGKKVPKQKNFILSISPPLTNKQKNTISLLLQQVCITVF